MSISQQIQLISMTYMLVGINPTKENKLNNYLTSTNIILLLKKSLNIDIDYWAYCRYNFKSKIYVKSLKSELLFSLYKIKIIYKQKLNCYRDKNDLTPNASIAEILPLKVELKLSFNEENNSVNSIWSILREENRMNLSPN